MDYVTASAVASKKKKTKRKAIGQQVCEESGTESKKKKKKKKKKDKNKKTSENAKASAKQKKKKKKQKKKNTVKKKKAELTSKQKAKSKSERHSKLGTGQSADADKLQLLHQDSPELISLLAEFKEKSATLKQQLAPLLLRIKNAELPVTDGVQFLEMKFHLLLAYCQHITFYLLLKAEGKCIKTHPVVESLLRIRTMMERLKPLDRKLKHQIDRLLDSARCGTSQSTTKPDPESLLPVDEGGDGQEKLYRAPKVMSVPFGSEDTSSADGGINQVRKRIKTSRVLRELKEAYSTAPESIQMRAGSNPLLDAEEKERRRFEEDNFTRLPVTRQLKRRRTAAQRQVGNMNDIFQEIKDFGKLKQLAGSAMLSDNNTKQKLEQPTASSFQRQVHALEQHNRKAKAMAWSSADAEVGLRDPEEIRRERGGRFDPTDETAMGGALFGQTPKVNNNDLPSVPQVSIGDEDVLYQRVAKQKSDKQRERKERYTRATMMTAAEEEVRGHNPRVASKKILRNKGLVAYRKKEARNPRIVKKVKFAKAKKRQKGQRPSMREHEHNYSGEASGIRDDITHSRQLKR